MALFLSSRNLCKIGFMFFRHLLDLTRKSLSRDFIEKVCTKNSSVWLGGAVPRQYQHTWATQWNLRSIKKTAFKITHTPDLLHLAAAFLLCCLLPICPVSSSFPSCAPRPVLFIPFLHCIVSCITAVSVVARPAAPLVCTLLSAATDALPVEHGTVAHTCFSPLTCHFHICTKTRTSIYGQLSTTFRGLFFLCGFRPWD